MLAYLSKFFNDKYVIWISKILSKARIDKYEKFFSNQNQALLQFIW